jgi:hypothetical protein
MCNIRSPAANKERTQQSVGPNRSYKLTREDDRLFTAPNYFFHLIFPPTVYRIGTEFPQRQTGLSSNKEKKIYFEAEHEVSADDNTVLQMVSAECVVGISRLNRTAQCKIRVVWCWS